MKYKGEEILVLCSLLRSIMCVKQMDIEASEV